MGTVEKTYYIATCDGCGKEFEADEQMAWASPEDAVDEAVTAGEWELRADETLRCEDCKLRTGEDESDTRADRDDAAAGDPGDD